MGLLRHLLYKGHQACSSEACGGRAAHSRDKDFHLGKEEETLLLLPHSLLAEFIRGGYTCLWLCTSGARVNYAGALVQKEMQKDMRGVQLKA